MLRGFACGWWLRVAGAKLTGAGRYRDILAMSDAGAEIIQGFVDVGLLSNACSRQGFPKRLITCLGKSPSQNRMCSSRKEGFSAGALQRRRGSREFGGPSQMYSSLRLRSLRRGGIYAKLWL